MKYVFFCLALVAFAGCSSIKVTSDYDKSVDFSKFKTYSYYGWTEESDKLLTPFDKERLEAAFADECQKRGIEYVEEGGDMVVSLFIVLDQKTSTTAYTNHYNMGGGAYFYNYGWGMGHSTTTYNETDYVVGTLVCDVFGSESKNLIWQAVGTKTVDDDPKSREENINRAVAKIMSLFPVEPQ